MDEWFDQYVEADRNGRKVAARPASPAGEYQAFPKQ